MVFMIGMLLTIPMSIVLLHQHNRWLRATGDTLYAWWMIGFVLWTFFWDARKRWPHLTHTQRAAAMWPDSRVHRINDELAAAVRRGEMDDAEAQNRRPLP